MLFFTQNYILYSLTKGNVCHVSVHGRNNMMSMCILTSANRTVPRETPVREKKKSMTLYIFKGDTCDETLEY